MENPFLAIVQAQLEAVHQSLRLAQSVRDVMIRNQRRLFFGRYPVPVPVVRRRLPGEALAAGRQQRR
jgi:hypothetical protein